MKHRIKNIIATGIVALVATFSVAGLQALPAAAVNPADAVNSGVKAAGGENEKGVDVRVKDVINFLLFIIGVVSVIMIIIGGIKYTLSNGDSSQITSAKNTILYAVIGLVVALLAYAIVNFVVGQF
jgi:hypothetical protein